MGNLKLKMLLWSLIWLVNTSVADVEGPTIKKIAPLDRLDRTTNQIFKIDEQQRLKAAIAAEYMNRIAVVNDRILNVFGDEGTFIMLPDEVTGQVFIKPSSDNGLQPLSITLITENGITQDLTLKPQKTSAKTLILKSQPVKDLNCDRLTTLGHSVQDEWLKIMKQAMLGELAVVKLKAANRSVAGFKLHFVKSYQYSDYIVDVWLIKNVTKETRALNEKIFFTKGDLLISLQKHLLEPSNSSYLYILRTE